MNRKLLLSIPALLLGALNVQAQAETPIYFNAPSTTHTAHAAQLPPTGARATAAPAETPIYFHAHAVQPVETLTTATPARTPHAQKNVESAGTPIYFRNNQG